MIDSRSGRLPEKDPRWDLSGTEACGGVKSISWTLLRVSDFSGIYSAGIRSNGDGVGPRGSRARHPLGRALVPRGPPLLLLALSRSFQCLSSPIKNLQKVWLHLDFVWY